MSSNGNKEGSSSKSVRFASNVKTSRPLEQEDSDDDENESRRKRPRMDRPNEDEADDIDDWEGDEEDAAAGLVPNSKDLLEAKRERRVRRQGMDDEDQDDTHIDASTSLLAEKDAEVTIEPFNMEAERSDGSGYFDGDTYIFRKRDVDEEPDAWLESLSDNKEVPKAAPEQDGAEGIDMDKWSREELYAKMIPLVSDSESVLQAVSRYGGLLKRRTKNKAATEADKSLKMAQDALNDLTEAANALLLKGDVDVYQKTRTDLMKLIPEDKPAFKDTGRPVVTWEYQGNQDGEVHGPYTTEQMTAWTQAGYFVGAQAVQIRTISEETAETKSAVDDLLSDLMDDDEEEKTQEPKQVKGEWRSSNDVDFSAYA